jgi:hypothetical protein
MKVLDAIIGFIMGVVALAALSQVHTGMIPTVAGLNLSAYKQAEFNMIPLAVFFVMTVGSIFALVSAFKSNDQ